MAPVHPLSTYSYIGTAMPGPVDSSQIKVKISRLFSFILHLKKWLSYVRSKLGNVSYRSYLLASKDAVSPSNSIL